MVNIDPPEPPDSPQTTQDRFINYACEGKPVIHYYCNSIPGDKELCEENLFCPLDTCEPEIGNPLCEAASPTIEFFYCGNLEAVNGQSQQRCLESHAL